MLLDTRQSIRFFYHVDFLLRNMNTITLTFFFSSTAKKKAFYLERLTGFETFISCFLLLFSCTFLFHSQVVLIRVYNCWRERERNLTWNFYFGQNSSIVYEHFHATLRTRTEKILCLIEKKFRTTSYLHAHWNKIVNVTEKKIVLQNNAREQ